MSVTMTKTEGVTVLTMTSDPQGALPPLCQFFKNLCCSPVCWSESQHLKKSQGTSQSALGTMQIMIGLLNIGIGAILSSPGSGSWWLFGGSMFPIWFGGLFIFFGAMSILSEKYPSLCLIVLSVILNIVGALFAITSSALYSSHMADIYFWWDCGNKYDIHSYGFLITTPAPSPEEMMLRRRCLEAQDISMVILKGLRSVLIILSLLHLCVTISSAVLGIKALCSRKKGEKSPDDLEKCKPLPKEVTSDPAP